MSRASGRKYSDSFKQAEPMRFAIKAAENLGFEVRKSNSFKNAHFIFARGRDGFTVKVVGKKIAFLEKKSSEDKNAFLAEHKKVSREDAAPPPTRHNCGSRNFMKLAHV